MRPGTDSAGTVRVQATCLRSGKTSCRPSGPTGLLSFLTPPLERPMRRPMFTPVPRSDATDARALDPGAPASRPIGSSAIVYCEGQFGEQDGKTANGLVRHSEKYDIL